MCKNTFFINRHDKNSNSHIMNKALYNSVQPRFVPGEKIMNLKHKTGSLKGTATENYCKYTHSQVIES